MSPRKRADLEIVKIAVQLYLDGEAVSSIFQKTGIRLKAIHRYMDENGLEDKKRLNFSKYREAIAEYMGNDTSVARVAEEFDLSVYSLGRQIRQLKELGVIDKDPKQDEAEQIAIAVKTFLLGTTVAEASRSANVDSEKVWQELIKQGILEPHEIYSRQTYSWIMKNRQAMAMYKAGIPIDEIVKEMNISRTTLYRYLEKADLIRKKGKDK